MLLNVRNVKENLYYPHKSGNISRVPRTIDNLFPSASSSGRNTSDRIRPEQFRFNSEDIHMFSIPWFFTVNIKSRSSPESLEISRICFQKIREYRNNKRMQMRIHVVRKSEDKWILKKLSKKNEVTKYVHYNARYRTISNFNNYICKEVQTFTYLREGICKVLYRNIII